GCPSSLRRYMAAEFSSPMSASTKALVQPRNCCSERFVLRVICTGRSGAVIAQGGLDVLGIHFLAVVQAREAGGDDLLGFFFAVAFDEAVVEMLAIERVIDLGFLVVVLQLGEIDYAVLARILDLPIDFEHYF